MTPPNKRMTMSNHEKRIDIAGTPSPVGMPVEAARITIVAFATGEPLQVHSTADLVTSLHMMAAAENAFAVSVGQALAEQAAKKPLNPEDLKKDYLGPRE
jgi:hypothetical protein